MMTSTDTTDTTSTPASDEVHRLQQRISELEQHLHEKWSESAWGSNPPAKLVTPPARFEDEDGHRATSALVCHSNQARHDCQNGRAGARQTCPTACGCRNCSSGAKKVDYRAALFLADHNLQEGDPVPGIDHTLHA
jgi:hypothetical protein